MSQVTLKVWEVVSELKLGQSHMHYPAVVSAAENSPQQRLLHCVTLKLKSPVLSLPFLKIVTSPVGANDVKNSV